MAWDSKVVSALSLLKQKDPDQLTAELSDWEEHGGLVFFKGHIYIPSITNVHRQIVRLCHESLPTGHPGRHRTLELVSCLYWWPGMTMFVNKFVTSCDTCQHCKPAWHPRSVLQPHEIPHGPWQTISIDLVTSLPLVDGYDVIVVYTDHYSKQVHIIPTTTDVDANGVTDIHYCEIFHLHGISIKIVSDHGPQFAVCLMKALYEKLRITHALTMAYHPQSNGQTEHTNQKVKHHLQLFISSHQDDWV